MVRLFDESQGAMWYHPDEVRDVQPTWAEQANYVLDVRDSRAFATVAWIDGVYYEVPVDCVVRVREIKILSQH